VPPNDITTALFATAFQNPEWDAILDNTYKSVSAAYDLQLFVQNQLLHELLTHKENNTHQERRVEFLTDEQNKTNLLLKQTLSENETRVKDLEYHIKMRENELCDIKDAYKEKLRKCDAWEKVMPVFTTTSIVSSDCYIVIQAYTSLKRQQEHMQDTTTTTAATPTTFLSHPPPTSSTLPTRNSIASSAGLTPHAVIIPDNTQFYEPGNGRIQEFPRGKILLVRHHLAHHLSTHLIYIAQKKEETSATGKKSRIPFRQLLPLTDDSLT
jgi:hypothetical protein